jgi:hypothetical protein
MCWPPSLRWREPTSRLLGNGACLTALKLILKSIDTRRHGRRENMRCGTPDARCPRNRPAVEAAVSVALRSIYRISRARTAFGGGPGKSGKRMIAPPEGMWSFGSRRSASSARLPACYGSRTGKCGRPADVFVGNIMSDESRREDRNAGSESSSDPGGGLNRQCSAELQVGPSEAFPRSGWQAIEVP